MTQHIKFIALLIFTLSASYTSAQSLRKKFIAALQNKNDSSTVAEQIDTIYPGGFQQFEKDFEAVYK